MGNFQGFPESNSQALQDIFVLGLASKREGSFVEIGGFHSRELSNTFLLETGFGWRGVIIEILPKFASELAANRSSLVLNQDALKVPWGRLIRGGLCPKEPDYLQVDCEPALTSLMALARALFFGLRPQIVTFEHDAYSAASLLRILPQGKLVRFFSRLGMKCLGYTLVAPNVLTASGKPFEDWWVRNSHASSLDYQKRGDTTVPAHFLASSGLVARYNELRFA